MTASVDPLGNRTSYAYDNAGNQTSVTNPLGFITTSVYSANSNRMSASVDPLCNRTTYSYDLAGQQTSRQDARGNRITYSYDLAGQVTTSADPRQHRTRSAPPKSGNQRVS